jgi:hypothetical protein
VQALEVGKGVKMEGDLARIEREVAAIGREMGRLFKVGQSRTGNIVVVRKA